MEDEHRPIGVARDGDVDQARLQGHDDMIATGEGACVGRDDGLGGTSETDAPPSAQEERDS